MSDAADIAHHAWGEDLRRRHIRRLDELADLAMDVARTLAAKAAQADADPEGLSRALARVSRAVRLTGLLQSKLLGDLDQAIARSAYLRARQEAAAGGPSAPDTPLDRHKARVERIVARIAEREHRGDEDEVERLTAECAERLDDEDVYGDVGARSVCDLVRLICKDLDLDERPFLHEAWALEEDSGSGNARPPPFAAANGGGGPPGERGEHPVVEGAGFIRPPLHSSA